MDPIKFLKHSWQMFVAQEEVGPWEHIWRRIRFFFDTDENFRFETLMYGAALVIIALLGIVLSWECVRRYRRRNNIDPQTAAEVLVQLKSNRENLKEIVNLLARRSENFQSSTPVRPSEVPELMMEQQEVNGQAVDGPIQCKIPVNKKLNPTPGRRWAPKKVRSTPN